MPDPYDLNALLEKLAEAQSLLEARAKTPELQAKLPGIKAQMEANLRKALEIKAEQENYLKRLRGEEVESDKEVEGDLDTVPDRFEKEHGLKSEQVEELIQILLAVVDQRRPVNRK